MLHRLSSEDVWRSVGEVLAPARAAGGAKFQRVPRLTISRSHLQDLVLVLQPFDNATNAPQGDWITMSSVIQALHDL